MNRQEFIRTYAKKTHTKIYQTEEFLENFENLIIELLKSGEILNFHGFFEIGTKKLRERPGTDPRNSKPITVKGRRKVYFRPLARLKAAAKDMPV